MRRLIMAICLAMAGGSGMGLAAHPALATSLCVGGPGCYPTIQAALDAAHSGDVIHIGPGTFDEDISIVKDVTIIGAGAGATIVHGVGTAPVVRIGVYLALSEPNVSISGVTITGGTNTSDTDPFQDSGGGIKVEPPAGPTPGSIGLAGTVTITNSVITGNSVRSLGGEPCGDTPTPICSNDNGGGISNFGTMTLTNTMVTNNTASWNVSPAPDFNQALGGGILNAGFGTLTVVNSTVTGNTVKFVSTEAVQGIFSAGGGIFNGGTATLVRNSTISGNTVRTVTAEAAQFDVTVGGAIANGGTLTVQGSTVSGNTVSFESAAAQPNEFAGGGGIDNGGPVTIDGSTISGNKVTVTSTSTDPTSGVFDAGGGVHIGGQMTIRGSQITGNRVSDTGYGGFVGAAGGGIDDDGSLLLLGSSVRDNHTSSTITSTLTTPSAFSNGGGMEVDGSATIRGTTFSGNTASATSPAATFACCFSGTFAIGGGLNVTNPSATVTMTDSIVTGNRAVASSTLGTATAPGGGIANSGILTLRNTTVSNNTAQANGPGADSFAGGGGIWNDNPPGPPSAQLTLIDSRIIHNSVTGSPGIQLHGGGLYNGTQATVTATNTVVALNTPDNCYPPNAIPGCTG